MIRNVLILYFFCAFFSGIAFCQEDIEIDSQVIGINLDKEYLIIAAGENEGVEIGDGLIVHRDAEKLAEAQIVEVRANVAAAEILNIEEEIKEGDNILIVKKAKKSSATIAMEEKTYQEPRKSKWTTLLGSSAANSLAAQVETTDSGYAVSGFGAQQSSIISTTIDADPSAVFSYALMTLRENGYSVILSNRVTGNILATMPIQLSLIKELWADATASVEHKLVVSLEMKNNEGTTELNIVSFKEHAQKKKQIKLPVSRESKYYNLLTELASKIKTRVGQ